MRFRRMGWGLLIVLGLFLATYVIAWAQASRLTTSYWRDAEAAYARGEYLEALTGYRKFDSLQNKYVQRGGYQQVESIWSHPNAWPRPEVYAQARTRIQEIITQRMTITMAEAYVQAHIGKSNPYLGDVYLRLGELYEVGGDPRSAIEVYREIADLFSARSDLIDRANGHLTSLGIQH